MTYTNPIAVSKNGGWRYNYGNMFYVELVNQYLTVKQFSNETVQAVMNEALKYQGWKYVYGGSNPNTSFDCSGLTQWCYGKAGISLPRTAQAQYDATQHIPLSQAQAGDLVFFHSTYNTSDYVNPCRNLCGKQSDVSCRKSNRLYRFDFCLLATAHHLCRKNQTIERT